MTVVDHAQTSRFVVFEGDDAAELTYRTDGDRLVLVHTGVPDAMGGRGIGGQLVAAAVARAEASGETLVPRCPFARSWLEKHPDEAARVAVDWGGSTG